MERAFVYWRDLLPMAERFRDEFSDSGVKPGAVDYEELISLGVFTENRFETG